MPKLIQFDTDSNGKASCTVVITECDCEIDESQNIIYLTNIVKDDTDVDKDILKFMILSGTNPIGSREAGPWSIKSEVNIGG